MGATITTRVPNEINKDIEFFVKVEKTDKSTLTRRLLAKALAEKKLDFALEKYKNGEISLWKAARLADMPLSKLMEYLKGKNVHLRYTEKDLEEDIIAAKSYKT